MYVYIVCIYIYDFRCFGSNILLGNLESILSKETRLLLLPGQVVPRNTQEAITILTDRGEGSIVQ